MTTAYPVALDSFVNPGPTTLMDAGAGLNHDEQHANINDAVEALQAKLGIDGSADASSIDYRLAAVVTGVGVVASDLAAHVGGIDPHGDRAYTDTVANNLYGVVTTDIGTAVADHVAALDPHGDRAYADAGDASTLSAAEGYADTGDAAALSSANGFTTSAIATHAAASDPHGDRAFTTSAITTHAGAADPHGDRAFATASIATHSAASDPHGDRAFATAAISTHNGVTTAHGISSYGASLVDDADAAAARGTLGLGGAAVLNVGTTAGTVAAGDHLHTGVYQPADAELAALAGLASAADTVPYFTGSGTAALATFTAAGRALVDDADASAQRTTLGLGGAAVLNVGTTAGTVAAGDHNHTGTYQPLDGELTALAGLTSAADKVPYFTGSGTAALADFSTFGRSLVDDADAAAGRATLGLGTISTQAASGVAITGGAIDGTPIGGTTKAAGSFTTLASRITDAGTNTVVTVATFSHASSGTAAAGLGVAINLEAQTSTGAMRTQGGISSEWIVATDATRRGTVRHYANEAFGGQIEYLLFQTDGAAGGTATANYDWRFTSSTNSTDPGSGAVVVGGGLGVGTVIRCGGGIYHADSTFIIHATSSLDNAAGSSAGTLTNAPAVGNPTKWLKIDDNGTTRYIPAW